MSAPRLALSRLVVAGRPRAAGRTGSVARMLEAAALGLVNKARYTLEATRSNEVTGQRPDEPLERTLDGIRATELICWEFVRGMVDCKCGGTRAHICHRACGGAINAALGGKHTCRKQNRCRFSHPEPAKVREELEASIGGVDISERIGEMALNLNTLWRYMFDSGYLIYPDECGLETPFGGCRGHCPMFDHRLGPNR